QRDLANCVLGELGWNSGCFLGPRYPDGAVLLDLAAVSSQQFEEFGSFRAEEMDQVELAHNVLDDIHVLWQRFKQGEIFARRPHRMKDRARLDSQFPGQRGPGISCQGSFLLSCEINRATPSRGPADRSPIFDSHWPFELILSLVSSSGTVSLNRT